jgi:DNA-binding LacI/PurR family transcriptional regulator
MANIFDVAKIAKVSTSTVSLAMRNSAKIKESTRLRVQAVATKLNYKPNRIACSLVQKKTNAIGVILPSSLNPIYIETNALIEKAAFEKGYDTFAYFIDEDPLRERRFLEKIYEQQVDGLIMIPAYPDVNRDYYSALAKSRVPIVIRDEIEWLSNVDSVSIDMEKGGYAAVKHLLALEHTRIACVTAAFAIGRKLGRLKGYRKALLEQGIAFDETLVRSCGTQLADGCSVTKDILAMKDRPSAIFMQCDLLAIGAFSAIRAAGLKVPEDISLVGFDNIGFAPYLEVPLTTVAQPKEKVALALVATLMNRIENKEAEPSHVVITPELIVRKSSGARKYSGL